MPESAAPLWTQKFYGVSKVHAIIHHKRQPTSALLLLQLGVVSVRRRNLLTFAASIILCKRSLVSAMMIRCLSDLFCIDWLFER